MAKPSMLTTNPLAVKLFAKKGWVQAMQTTMFGHAFNRGSVFFAEELMGKSTGDDITYSFLNKLTKNPIGEGGVARNNEEAVDLGNYKMTMNISRIPVLSFNEDTIEQQRTYFKFKQAAETLLPDRAAELLDASFFYQLAGANPNSYSLDGTTYATVADKLHVQGHNTPIAPSTGRILRANNAANDESLTPTDVISLDMIDFALRDIAKSIQPIKRFDDGTYDLYLSPDDIVQLKHNAGAKIQWFNIQLALLTGGKKSQIESQYENGITLAGKYANVNIYEAPRVAYGVNSSTGAVITTVRRNVLVGKNALAFASPFGGRASDKNVPIKFFEDTFDYEYYVGVEGRLMYGMKKIQPSNGLDVGVFVLSTYAG